MTGDCRIRNGLCWIFEECSSTTVNIGLTHSERKCSASIKYYGLHMLVSHQPKGRPKKKPKKKHNDDLEGRPTILLFNHFSVRGKIDEAVDSSSRIALVFSLIVLCLFVCPRSPWLTRKHATKQRHTIIRPWHLFIHNVGALLHNKSNNNIKECEAFPAAAWQLIAKSASSKISPFPNSRMAWIMCSSVIPIWSFPKCAVSSTCCSRCTRHEKEKRTYHGY